MSFSFFALLAMDGLEVRTTTPLALCPTVEAVEVALSERLHVVENDHKLWEVVLENAHRTEPAADLLRVVVRDEQGETRVDQELDVSGADCSVRAQTVALVVADYFESRRLDAAPVPPAPEPTPAQVVSPPVDAPVSAAPDQRRHDHLSLGVGVSANDAFSPGFAARLVGRPSEHFELSALMLAPARESERLAEGGRAEVLAWPLRVSPAFSLRFAHASLWLGPEALISYERGTTRDIADSQTNHRWVWGFGAQAGARFFGTSPWAGYVVLAVDYPLPVPASRFKVDGETVLEPGPVRWGAALGVEFDVF
jgi:hypothetical protein